MAVPTTVVGVAFEPALVALLLVAAHHGGSAIPDMMHHLQVFKRQAVSRCIGFAMALEDVRDFEGLSTGYKVFRRLHGKGFRLQPDPTD